MGPELPGPERPGEQPRPPLVERRTALAGAVAAGIWRVEPAPEEITLSGVRVLVFRPSGVPYGAVLHMHGGAFRIGCPEQVAGFAQALAARCNVTVFCPAYRLAPEHPFPAALNDGWAVLAAIREQVRGPVIFSGDSAGGRSSGGAGTGCRGGGDIAGRACSALCVAGPYRDEPMLPDECADRSAILICFRAGGGGALFAGSCAAGAAGLAYICKSFGFSA